MELSTKQLSMLTIDLEMTVYYTLNTQQQICYMTKIQLNRTSVKPLSQE